METTTTTQLAKLNAEIDAITLLIASEKTELKSAAEADKADLRTSIERLNSRLEALIAQRHELAVLAAAPGKLPFTVRRCPPRSLRPPPSARPPHLHSSQSPLPSSAAAVCFIDRRVMSPTTAAAVLAASPAAIAVADATSHASSRRAPPRPRKHCP